MQLLRNLKTIPAGNCFLMAFLATSLGIVLLVGTQSVREARRQFDSSLAMVVFMEPGFPESQSDAWIAKAREADPEITSFTFQSAQQAYDQASQDPILSKSLRLLEKNPLPSSFTLRLSPVAWATRMNPSQPLTSLPSVAEIRWDTSAQLVFRILFQWERWLSAVSAAVAIVLMLALAINLYQRIATPALWKGFGLQLLMGLVGSLAAYGVWEVALRIGVLPTAIVKPSPQVWALAVGLIAAALCLPAPVSETLVIEEPLVE